MRPGSVANARIGSVDLAPPLQESGEKFISGRTLVLQAFQEWLRQLAAKVLVLAGVLRDRECSRHCKPSCVGVKPPRRRRQKSRQQQWRRYGPECSRLMVPAPCFSNLECSNKLSWRLRNRPGIRQGMPAGSTFLTECALPVLPAACEVTTGFHLFRRVGR